MSETTFAWLLLAACSLIYVWWNHLESSLALPMVPVEDDDEPPTRPDTRISICPKCHGAGRFIASVIVLCDFCAGEGRVDTEKARQWKIRNG